VISDGELVEMTEEERQALPAENHQPHWMGLTTPPTWICRVCWGDGWTASWPCKVAERDGKAVAEAGGLSFSW
jgi:hypothetical protein